MASLEQKTLLYPRNSKGLVGSVPGTGVQSPNVRTKDGPRAPIPQKIVSFQVLCQELGTEPNIPFPITSLLPFPQNFPYLVH